MPGTDPAHRGQGVRVAPPAPGAASPRDRRQASRRSRGRAPVRVAPPPPLAPLSAEVVQEVVDPIASARAVGLRYVNDGLPGIRRRRAGKGFYYLDAQGRPVKDEETLRRIRSLAIPPAWSDVWICPLAHGHLQASGRDAKGRKQYRYHPRWRQIRDEVKFGRMIAFARALPLVRERVERDLARAGLPREKALATVVRLLETTLIRVGNEEYARANDSYGLTTLRADHVDVEGAKVRFEFRGKSGRHHLIEVSNRKLAGIVRRMKDLPGYELFGYVDPDGSRETIDADDVNRYLRDITGEDFTAKDFRTWAATVLAFRTLRESGVAESQAAAKRTVVRAVEEVAKRLGNTPAICRKSYIHPAVLEAYPEGGLAGIGPQAEIVGGTVTGLRTEETEVLTFLETRLQSAGTEACHDLADLLARSMPAA